MVEIPDGVLGVNTARPAFPPIVGNAGDAIVLIFHLTDAT